MIIDLSKYKKTKSLVLSGREEGKEIRNKLNLETLDKKDETIEIIIPDEILSLNSSYFLGLFGPSVRILGESKFREKYVFKCTPIIKKSVDDGISRALKITNPLES